MVLLFRVLLIHLPVFFYSIAVDQALNSMQISLLKEKVFEFPHTFCLYASAPVDTPVDAPVHAPVDASVHAPLHAPVDVPVHAPVDAPEAINQMNDL